MMAFLVILLLFLVGLAGVLFAIRIHLTLKEEFRKKQWMDNSEYEYGHDVHYYQDNI